MRRILLAVAVSGVLLAGCYSSVRSLDSYLPSTIFAARIHYHPARGLPDRYLRVTNPQTLRDLVRTFNSLAPEVPGPRACAADYGQYAEVTFVTAAGSRFEVLDGLPCWDLSISTSPQHLYDRGQFWPLLAKLLGLPGY